MARRLKKRSPAPVQRHTAPSRPNSASPTATLEPPHLQQAPGGRPVTSRLVLPNVKGSTTLLSKSGPSRSRNRATQAALLLHMQRTRGNRAVQLLLQRSAPAIDEAITTPENRVLTPSASTSHQQAANSTRPVVSMAQLNQPSVQRLSWSDLNPIDAAKRLAERAWSGIKDLGSAAWDTAKEV